MKYRLFIPFLRILLGGIFVFSAVAKIINIDHFELYIYSHQFFGFDISSVIARVVIAAEIALGLLLAFNLYFKTVYKASLYLLLFFSLFLSVKLFIPDDENCHCFGELFQFNASASLLKNFILILLFFLIKRNGCWSFQFRKMSLFFILLTAVVFPNVVSPPDFLYKDYSTYTINNTDTQLIQLSDTTIHIEKGKKVLVFLSMGCKYCTLTAHKISIIANRTKKADNICYIFFGDEKKLESFWKNSQSRRFKYTFIPYREMFEITDGHLPSIFFVENGYIKLKTNYRGLNEKQFLDFFR